MEESTLVGSDFKGQMEGVDRVENDEKDEWVWGLNTSCGWLKIHEYFVEFQKQFIFIDAI